MMDLSAVSPRPQPQPQPQPQQGDTCDSYDTKLCGRSPSVFTGTPRPAASIPRSTSAAGAKRFGGAGRHSVSSDGACSEPVHANGVRSISLRKSGSLDELKAAAGPSGASGAGGLRAAERAKGRAQLRDLRLLDWRNKHLPAIWVRHSALLICMEGMRCAIMRQRLLVFSPLLSPDTVPAAADRAGKVGGRLNTHAAAGEPKAVEAVDCLSYSQLAAKLQQTSQSGGQQSQPGGQQHVFDGAAGVGSGGADAAGPSLDSGSHHRAGTMVPAVEELRDLPFEFRALEVVIEEACRKLQVGAPPTSPPITVPS